MQIRCGFSFSTKSPELALCSLGTNACRCLDLKAALGTGACFCKVLYKILSSSRCKPSQTRRRGQDMDMPDPEKACKMCTVGAHSPALCREAQMPAVGWSVPSLPRSPRRCAQGLGGAVRGRHRLGGMQHLSQSHTRLVPVPTPCCALLLQPAHGVPSPCARPGQAFQGVGRGQLYHNCQ